jgi:hypothetical protein
MNAAHLAHILQGSRANFIAGDGWFKIKESFYVSAHAFPPK